MSKRVVVSLDPDLAERVVEIRRLLAERGWEVSLNRIVNNLLRQRLRSIRLDEEDLESLFKG